VGERAAGPWPISNEMKRQLSDLRNTLISQICLSPFDLKVEVCMHKMTLHLSL